MTVGVLDHLAEQHLGNAPDDYRAACPNCNKPGDKDAANVTVNPDGSIVAYCHRCGESGTARQLNGWKRPAARVKAASPPEDHAALWASGTEPGESCEHPYLIRKQVGAHGIRIAGDLLLIPMRTTAGELVGAQKIKPDATKLYTRGAQPSGAYHAIGKPDGSIIVAEGYATGASIFEATGIATAIAFSRGNLLAVAKALRAKYPTTTIILAADDDARTADNPGIRDATAAAKAIGGRLAIPDFGPDRPDGATDFNDLALHRGPESVRECIATAQPAEPDDGIIVGGALTLAASMADLNYIVEPILSRGQRGTFTGHPGHGKTTLIVGLLAAFAADRSFGPLTPRGGVLAYIVSAEDFQGTRNRILAEAARLHLDADERTALDARLRWVHVETSATALAIKAAIERDADGRDVALIFVDTGPALFCGESENDNVELRNFVESFGCMAKLPGKPATVLAWHPSKGAPADRLEPRGASAIKGTCDFNLTIWRDDDRITVSHTKLRGEHFDPIEGRLSTVELEAASGRRYFAPVVTLDATDDRPERSDASKAREAILKHLHTGNTRTVRDLSKAIGISSSPTFRHLQHLASTKPALVTKDPVDDSYTLTKAGEARAKALIEPTRQAYQNARDPG